MPPPVPPRVKAGRMMAGKPMSLKVSYVCGLRYPVNEWVCFEHGGYAQKKAAQWWHEQGGHGPVPETVDLARVRIEAGETYAVTQITVDCSGEYPQLRSVKREGEPGTNEDPADTRRPEKVTIDYGDIPF